MEFRKSSRILYLILSLKLTWPLKIGLPNRKVVFQPSIFRGELLVSGRVYLQYLQAKILGLIRITWGSKVPTKTPKKVGPLTSTTTTPQLAPHIALFVAGQP